MDDLAGVISVEPRTISRKSAASKPPAGGEGDAAGSHLLTGNSGSLIVLYATATGTAELLAHGLAAEIRSTGIAAHVRDMAHCQPDLLKQMSCVLMVVSTYGAGEPPEGAAAFYDAVVNGPRMNLAGLRFSVLALGNTTFDYFCRCGKELDAALERHGATRLYPRVDCDVDYDVPARQWLNGVLTALLGKGRTAG